MKKLLSTLLLSLLTLTLYCQVYGTAKTLTIGVRDDQYSEFTWGDTREISGNIPFVINNRDITIFTEDIQVYQTVQPEHRTEENDASWWLAIDSEGRKCKFYLYSTSDIIMIVYDDVCIIYGVSYE